MKLSTFLTDLNKETQGVWITPDETDENFKLLIGRLGNELIKAYVFKHGKKEAAALSRGQGDVKKIEELNTKAYAKFILLGWEGLLDDDGNEIVYSYEKAKELLQIGEFRDMILDYAGDIENYRKADEEAITGN